MSYDLAVFGADDPPAGTLSTIAEDVGGRLAHEGAESAAIVERPLRGGFDYAFHVDGPLHIEREDLPDPVVAAAVGIQWTWQLTVEGSASPSIKLAKSFARQLAEKCRGVVYDPQEDGVTWPRKGTRAFTPPPEETIDVLQLEWFVRREDADDDLPAVVFDTLASMLPEGLPRRFGSFEPLQHRLEETGREGFLHAWRSENMSLFWKTSRPCIGGSMYGLGDDLIGIQHAGPHPVGTVRLSVDARTLHDDRWREEVVQLFAAMSRRTRAFYACVDVDRTVGYRSGNLWYGPDSETQAGLVVRNVWMGLPDHEVWLAWYGNLYRDLVERHLTFGKIENGEVGVLVRASELPPGVDTTSEHERWPKRRRLFGRSAVVDDATPLPRPTIPRELMLKVIGSGQMGSHQRERADRVPEGLGKS